jgi:hypothetical protein
MMDVIMEKLAETTAEMPEVAGTAAASWAALGVTFKNLKDQVGLSLVPALETLLNALVPLIQEYGPRLVTLFAEKVVPVVERVAEALALMLGGDIEAGLEKLFGTERTQQILAAAAAISTFAANLASALMGNEQGRTWATDMLAGLIEGIAAWFESGVLEDQAGELGEKLGAFLVDTLSATITSKDSENKIANALAQLLRAAPAAIWGAAGEMGLGIGEEAGAALREKLGKEPLSEEERERRTEMARNVNTFRDIKDWWTGPFAETPFAQWADSLATKIETLVGVRSPQLSADTLGDGRAGTETNTYNISFEPGAVVIEEKDTTDANAVEYSMELGILKALSAAGVR